MFVEPVKAQRLDPPLRRLHSHGPALLYRDDGWETKEPKEQFRRVEGRAERLRRYERRAARQQPLFGGE